MTHLYLFIFFHPLCNFQEVETGEHGTSGVCARRRVIQVGSVAFGCVKAQEFRITPVMAWGRKCAPAMTRSAQVCVCPYVCVCTPVLKPIYPSLIFEWLSKFFPDMQFIGQIHPMWLNENNFIERRMDPVPPHRLNKCQASLQYLYQNFDSTAPVP